MDKQTARQILKAARELGYIATANPHGRDAHATSRPPVAPAPAAFPPLALADVARSAGDWEAAAIFLAARLHNTNIKDAARLHRADCRVLEITLENLDAASPAAEDVPDDYDTDTPINPAAVAIEDYLCEQGQWRTCDESAAFSSLHIALQEIADAARTAMRSIDAIRAAQDKRLILTQRHG